VQSFWAVPWLKTFGFSRIVLQFATIPFSLGFVLLVYATGIRAGISRELSAFAAIGSGTSPLFLPFAATFMTEAYGCFFSMACVYCGLRALQAEESRSASRWILALSLTGLLGGANRQIVWAAPLALIPVIAWRWRSRKPVLRQAALSFGVLCVGIVCILQWFSPPYPGFRLGGDLWAWLLIHKSAAAGRFMTQMVLLCVLLAMPAFLLPLPGIPVRRLVWLPIVIAELLIVTFAGIVVGWPVAPYGNNIISIGGIAIGNQDAGGAIVTLFPDWFRIALTALVNLCFFAALRRASHLRRGASLPPNNRAFFLAAAVFTVGYLALIVPGALIHISFDRYMLPLVPLVYLGVVSQAKPDRPFLPLAWVCMLLFAGYAVATTHDYAAASRARVSAARTLEAAGVPRERISASFEYDGWGELERREFARGTQYGDRFGERNSKGFWFEFWDHLSNFQPDYVALNWILPETPHGCVSFVEYSAWLPPFRRYVAVWKRQDLTAELRAAQVFAQTGVRR
jgi:hypothetical protein